MQVDGKGLDHFPHPSISSIAMASSSISSTKNTREALSCSGS